MISFTSDLHSRLSVSDKTHTMISIYFKMSSIAMVAHLLITPAIRWQKGRKFRGSVSGLAGATLLMPNLTNIHAITRTKTIRKGKQIVNESRNQFLFCRYHLAIVAITVFVLLLSVFFSRSLFEMRINIEQL